MSTCWSIDPDQCVGCGACVEKAPYCITMEEDVAVFINHNDSTLDKFIHCCDEYVPMLYEAEEACPVDAIESVGW